jgi:hypothetical protein
MVEVGSVGKRVVHFDGQPRCQGQQGNKWHHAQCTTNEYLGGAQVIDQSMETEKNNNKEQNVVVRKGSKQRCTKKKNDSLTTVLETTPALCWIN